MTCRIKLGSHAYFHIQTIPVTSLDKVISSLALFGFVLLYYLFFDVCSNMLTCLFYIMFEYFSNDQDYKKYDRLELSILLSLTKDNPNRHRTCYR